MISQTTNTNLPTFLPGQLTLRPGARQDFHSLSRFHYLPDPPATYAQIWTITYTDPLPSSSSRPVAVATISYPTPRNRGREHYFNSAAWRYRDQILFANANLRTLSRVIVHPQFRSLGLATLLTRHCCRESPTRYTESVAAMGRVHPFLERAGMKRVQTPGEDTTAYFIHDKAEDESNG